jgi:hypothetical protein
VCWRIHADDAAQFAADGRHCETRHGREFAGRHGIDLEPAPPERSQR